MVVSLHLLSTGNGYVVCCQKFQVVHIPMIRNATSKLKYGLNIDV